METVDNIEQWTAEVAHDELPYHEALARLYELSERYGHRRATSLVGSAAAVHYEETGHRLAFGCCATEESIMAALNREERRLLRSVEREQGWP